MSTMTILDVKWRNSRWTMGVVLTVNKMGVVKAYMGVGEGEDAVSDMEMIASYGCKLIKEEALAFFPQHREYIENNYWKPGG